MHLGAMLMPVLAPPGLGPGAEQQLRCADRVRLRLRSHPSLLP